MKMRFFFFLLEYAFTKHIPLFLCRFGRRCLEVFKYDGHLHIPETESHACGYEQIVSTGHTKVHCLRSIQLHLLTVASLQLRNNNKKKKKGTEHT